jgi:hypothetical protein
MSHLPIKKHKNTGVVKSKTNNTSATKSLLDHSVPYILNFMRSQRSVNDTKDRTTSQDINQINTINTQDTHNTISNEHEKTYPNRHIDETQMDVWGCTFEPVVTSAQQSFTSIFDLRMVQRIHRMKYQQYLYNEYLKKIEQSQHVEQLEQLEQELTQEQQLAQKQQEQQKSKTFLLNTIPYTSMYNVQFLQNCMDN